MRSGSCASPNSASVTSGVTSLNTAPICRDLEAGAPVDRAGNPDNVIRQKGWLRRAEPPTTASCPWPASEVASSHVAMSLIILTHSPSVRENAPNYTTVCEAVPGLAHVDILGRSDARRRAKGRILERMGNSKRGRSVGPPMEGAQV